MDALVAQIQDTLEGQIDFEGQRLSELICTTLLSLTAAVALIIGFVKQDIFSTMWIGLSGTAITVLIIVPPWPLYNQNPQSFLGSNKRIAGLPEGGIVVGGKMSK